MDDRLAATEGVMPDEIIQEMQEVETANENEEDVPEQVTNPEI